MKLPHKAPRQFGAMRKGQSVVIDLDHRRRPAIFLGAGRFTNAFLINRSDVILFSHFGDCSKEIIQACNHRRQNKHIPKMEKIDVISGPRNADWDVHIYKSRFYNPVEGGSAASEMAKAITQARIKASNANRGGLQMLNTGRCYEVNCFVASNAQVPAPLRDALQELADTATNWENYLFDDFKPHNCGQDLSGRLILLDPLFSAQLIEDDWQARTKGG